MASHHTIESLADSVHILIVVLVVLIIVIGLVVIAQIFNIVGSIIDYCASRKQKSSDDDLSGVTVVKNRKSWDKSKKRPHKQLQMSSNSATKTSKMVPETRASENVKLNSKQTPIGGGIQYSSNKSSQPKSLNMVGDNSALVMQLSSVKLTEAKKDSVNPSTSSALKPMEKKDLLVEFSPTTVNDPIGGGGSVAFVTGDKLAEASIGLGSVVAVATDHKLTDDQMKTALPVVYPDEQPISDVKSRQQGGWASTQSVTPSISSGSGISSSWTPLSQSDFGSALDSVNTASMKTASPPKTAECEGQSGILSESKEVNRSLGSVNTASVKTSSPPKTAELKEQSGVVPGEKEGIQLDTSAVPVADAENVLVETKIQPGSMV